MRCAYRADQRVFDVSIFLSVVPAFSCFFFQGYADYRDLHSFPTRRSSDLSMSTNQPETGALTDKAALITGAARPDRKSTRLNSSHQIISYAVFCLKKKKR